MFIDLMCLHHTDVSASTEPFALHLTVDNSSVSLWVNWSIGVIALLVAQRECDYRGIVMVSQSILKVNIDPTSPSLLTTLQTMGATP